MGEVAKRDIKELKEMMGNLMDAVEVMAGDFKDGRKIMEEIKDIDMAEGMELAMMVMMRLPKLMDAFKKDPEA